MIVLARATEFVGAGRWCPPLTWTPMPAATPHALVSCANGHECHLSAAKHQVAADGTVTPSAVCPVKGCTWHEMIRLDGWSPGVVA